MSQPAFSSKCYPRDHHVLVRTLLWSLPFSRDIVWLGVTSRTASIELQRLVAALREDFSRGAERSHPIVLQSPPLPSRHPPLPLDFTYIPPHTNLLPAIRAAARLADDTGCPQDCDCCRTAPPAASAAAASHHTLPSGPAIYAVAHRALPSSSTTADPRSNLAPFQTGGFNPVGADVGSDAATITVINATAITDGGRDSGSGSSRLSQCASCRCGVLVPGGWQAYDSRTGLLLPSLLPPPGEDGAMGAKITRQQGPGVSGYVLECGPACACACDPDDPHRPNGISIATHHPGPPCPARVTQRGVGARVELRWWPHKGWGAVAAESLPAGRFVACYEGEYLNNTEAGERLAAYDKQGSGHALLVVREVLPSGLILRLNVDATWRGNVARFFNHSCDGGSLMLVMVRRRGSFLPAVALFAARDIAVGEELTFAYGSPSAGPAAGAALDPAESAANCQRSAHRGQTRCSCGTRACLGFMPSEDTGYL